MSLFHLGADAASKPQPLTDRGIFNAGVAAANELLDRQAALIDKLSGDLERSEDAIRTLRGINATVADENARLNLELETLRGVLTRTVTPETVPAGDAAGEAVPPSACHVPAEPPEITGLWQFDPTPVANREGLTPLVETLLNLLPKGPVFLLQVEHINSYLTHATFARAVNETSRVAPTFRADHDLPIGATGLQIEETLAKVAHLLANGTYFLAHDGTNFWFNPAVPVALN